MNFKTLAFWAALVFFFPGSSFAQVQASESGLSLEIGRIRPPVKKPPPVPPAQPCDYDHLGSAKTEQYVDHMDSVCDGFDCKKNKISLPYHGFDTNEQKISHCEFSLVGEKRFQWHEVCKFGVTTIRLCVPAKSVCKDCVTGLIKGYSLIPAIKENVESIDTCKGIFTAAAMAAFINNAKTQFQQKLAADRAASGNPLPPLSTDQVCIATPF